jgi:hypothetical protein
MPSEDFLGGESMSSLQGKSLEAITERDLQQMVTQNEQESQTLEYKKVNHISVMMKKPVRCYAILLP